MQDLTSPMTVSTTPPVAAGPRPAQPGFDLDEFWVSSLQWIQTNWFEILISGAIASGIILGLYALRRIGRKWSDRERGAQWLAIIGRALCRTTSFFIIMVAIAMVDGYAQTPPLLSEVITFFFTVAAVLQGAIWARELIIGAIEHRTASEHFRGEAIINAMGLIRLLVGVVVFAIAAVVLLDNLGVNVTGLVAGLGVGGIAIGLAAQGIFADLFAALAIIFDRPFSKGDGINVDGKLGTIEAIGLKSTRIRMYSGELLIVSNKNLLDKEILNLTGREHIRLSFTIGLAYETPPDLLARVPGILTELVEAEGGHVSRASFEGFGASSIDLVLFVDVPGNDWSIAHPLRDRLMVGIMRRFAAEGIVIPYPTQTTYTAAPDGTLVLPYAEDRHEIAPGLPPAND